MSISDIILGVFGGQLTEVILVKLVAFIISAIWVSALTHPSSDWKFQDDDVHQSRNLDHWVNKSPEKC